MLAPHNMAAIAEIGAFERSVLTDAAPPATLPPPLRALWHAKKAGFEPASPEFSAALTVITSEEHGHPGETNLAWAHALLLRAADCPYPAASDGPAASDEASAAHWYGVAGRPIPSGAPEAEWRTIASTLLGEVLQNGAAGPDAMEKALAARSIADPTRYLEALGMNQIPHGSRGADLAHGSFMDHLLGVEVAMRELGCGESMALAGLMHSVYGTEGFQYYTLPLSERPKVRELIGARGELAVFYNCVMDRDSLDVLCAEVASRMDAGGSAPYGTSGTNAGDDYFFGDGYGGDAAAEAATLDRHVGYLSARPSAKTGLTGEERYAVTLQELQDIAMLHYADHFDEMEYKSVSAGQVPHRVGGEEGRWYWEAGATSTVRPEFRDAVVRICGEGRPVYCPAFKARWQEYQDLMPPGTPLAVWLPTADGRAIHEEPAQATAKL